mmetsp:Transcript_6053/g.8531  ORF Transcript_6053/g.8531 Transcript_6053/m.8531 type:complete len:240 (-) Transcript_6053:137-856(-)
MVAGCLAVTPQQGSICVRGSSAATVECNCLIVVVIIVYNVSELLIPTLSVSTAQADEIVVIVGLTVRWVEDHHAHFILLKLLNLARPLRNQPDLRGSHLDISVRLEFAVGQKQVSLTSLELFKVHTFREVRSERPLCVRYVGYFSRTGVALLVGPANKLLAGHSEAHATLDVLHHRVKAEYVKESIETVLVEECPSSVGPCSAVLHKRIVGLSRAEELFVQLHCLLFEGLDDERRCLLI